MKQLIKFIKKSKAAFKNTSSFTGPFSNANGFTPNLLRGQESQTRASSTNATVGSSSKKLPKYSAAEVKRYLRGLEEGPRARVIIEEARNFPNYAEKRMPECLRGRERFFERLPSVLFQYTQGKPTREIASTVGYLSDNEDVEVAMDYVSELIARRVNYRLGAGRFA